MESWKFESINQLIMAKFSELLLKLTLIALVFGVSGEETCSIDGDGVEICEESGGDDNVWTKQEESQLGPLPKDVDELEFELFVAFFSSLKDWTPSSESLNSYSPEELVSAVMNTFVGFDLNDDGILQFDEVEELLKQNKNEGNLGKIEGIFEAYGGEISIFQFFQFFKKLGKGKLTPLLVPFEKLKYMPTIAAKRMILGSVQMFKDADEDGDGQLDKDEFANGMQKSREKHAEKLEHLEVSDEHINNLFELIDKDKDGYLEYPEFQATMPEQPKSFQQEAEEIFKEADEDGDGELSKEEFKAHLTLRSAKMNVDGPTDEHVSIAYEKLDKNGDGALSLDEMKALMDEAVTIQEQKMMEAFKGFDVDGDGLLNMDELQHIVKGMEKATGQKVDGKMFMTLLDEDKDGFVNIEEMQKALKKMSPTVQ